MELTAKVKSIYDKINFYNRYEKLSKDYQFDNTFENYSNVEVLKLIENFGYKVKYVKSENFFQIKEIVCNTEFLFHICLKYGLAELMMYSKNLETNEKTGNVFSMIAKLIEIAEKREKDGYIRKPRFRNYEDLREILKEAFSIYEDFKREIQMLN